MATAMSGLGQPGRDSTAPSTILEAGPRDLGHSTAGRQTLPDGAVLGSEALETKYMVERNPMYRVEVDQCMFGLKEPVSLLKYRKATALDVTDQAFAVGLAGV